jgi:hypothetical protein
VRQGEGEEEVKAMDLEMIPDVANEIAVRNQRTFVKDSCKLPPARG